MKRESQKPMIVRGTKGTHLQLVAIVFPSCGNPLRSPPPISHPSGTAYKTQQLSKSPRFCCSEWVFLICSEDLPDCHKQCGCASLLSEDIFRSTTILLISHTPRFFPSPKAFPFGPYVRKCPRLHFPPQCQVLTSEQPPQVLCCIKGAFTKLHSKWLWRKHPDAN